MKRFTIGQKVSTRSACDHNCIFRGTITKRSPKMVTVEVENFGTKRCKVIEWEGSEMIYPLGRYSMAPVFEA